MSRAVSLAPTCSVAPNPTAGDGLTRLQATINKHPNRFELTAVYRHPQAKADIVLVHGLNGAPEKTWTATNGVYWPTDLLPASLKDQHANVLVYGYNADVYGGFWERPVKSPSDNFIHHHAQTLVATLAHYRKSEGTERNPIIWVVHSLGGIVTKRAILYSNDLRDPNQEDLRSIYVSTYGIIFLGTPHTGAGAAAWGGVVQRMADALVPRKLFETESVLLKSLKKDNETLQQINNHFLDIYQKFKIHMVHENQKTDVKGSK
jgi:pimeloyl-ACP methyl ester carboxylesterase